MPCTYTGSLEGDRILALKQSKEELSDTITELVQMICGIMSYVENQGLVTDVEELYSVDGLEKFWTEHKKIDEERKQKEKEAALNKLTKREKELLGLSPKKR